MLLTGRALDIETMQPGWLARRLAGHVRCRTDSKGLSVPEKMEYVVRTIGYRRVVAAAIAGAMTRPLGIRGTFYRLAGSVARDIDGGRPPYEHLLFPPLDTSVAQQICSDLERALGIGVSIVDLNDFGGSIRACLRNVTLRCHPRRSPHRQPNGSAPAEYPIRHRPSGRISPFRSRADAGHRRLSVTTCTASAKNLTLRRP